MITGHDMLASWGVDRIGLIARPRPSERDQRGCSQGGPPLYSSRSSRRAAPYPRGRRVGLGRILRRCTTSAARPSPPKARQIGSASGRRVELSLGPLPTVLLGGGVVEGDAEGTGDPEVAGDAEGTGDPEVEGDAEGTGDPEVEGDAEGAETGEVKHVVVIVLASRVTAPVLASARPWSTTPVAIVMEA